MKIVTAFAIVPGPESWEETKDGFEIFEHDEGTEDFVVGTFSSLEEAKEKVESFLASYKVGDEEQQDRIGWHAPILSVTYWETELDVGGAEGKFLERRLVNGEDE